MTPDEWIKVIESATPLVVALVTGGLGFGGSYLVYLQAEKRRALDERRWSDQKFRDETFRTAEHLVEAIADYDDALAALNELVSSKNEVFSPIVENAKNRVVAADRELNRAKQVAELFVEHKDPSTAECIRELRRRYEDVRLAVLTPGSVSTQQFFDLRDRQKQIRNSAQEGLLRLLRSYSTD